MLRIISIIICFFIVSGCSNNGNHQKNKERLQAEFGCENPFEPLSKRKYKECKAKERAGGESLFNLKDAVTIANKRGITLKKVFN